MHNPRLFTEILRWIFPLSSDARAVEALTDAARREIYTLTKVDGVDALSPYRNETVRALIWEAKFHNSRVATSHLGALLNTYLQCDRPQPSVLIPIPMTRSHLRERGYNQVENIVEAALVEGSPHTLNTNLLIRTRNTPRQTNLSRKERLTNMENVFAVRETDLDRNTPFLIVDDIITTGATLRSARKALQEAGFCNVVCVAIAH